MTTPQDKQPRRSISAAVRYQLDRLFWQSDFIATRFTLAFGALMWAVLLAWPGDLFHARPVYRVMAEVAPQTVWALAFGIQGLFALAALLTGCRNRLVWFMEGLGGCILWTAACIACLTAFGYESPPATMASDIALAGASWWNLVRWQVNK